MEIKRKLKISATTKRRIFFADSTAREPIICSKCGSVQSTVREAALFLGIKQRRIFQLIELNEVHYSETETGEVMICPSTVKMFQEGEN